VKKDSKKFDTVEFMREQRTKIANETKGHELFGLEVFWSKEGKNDQMILPAIAI
jgi:hypothetical protein